MKYSYQVKRVYYVASFLFLLISRGYAQSSIASIIDFEFSRESVVANHLDSSQDTSLLSYQSPSPEDEEIGYLISFKIKNIQQVDTLILKIGLQQDDGSVYETTAIVSSGSISSQDNVFQSSLFPQIDVFIPVLTSLDGNAHFITIILKSNTTNLTSFYSEL